MKNSLVVERSIISHLKKDSYKRVKMDFHTCNEETAYLGSYSAKNNELTMIDKSYSLFSDEPEPINETVTLTYEVNNDFLILRKGKNDL